MNLELKLIHQPGMYALIRVHADKSEKTVQTAYYNVGNGEEKAKAHNDLYCFAQGVSEGWDLARHSLYPAHLANRVEEREAKAKS